MYGVAPMMGLHMDKAKMLGSMLGGRWTLGLLMHFVNGTIIFPLIFAYVLYGWLPSGPVLKGTTWGTLLWLLAQGLVMPMMGAGFFSAAIGGMMAAAGSLVAHVLYGSVLGAIASVPEPARVSV
jgi:hypothetical protein